MVHDGLVNPTSNLTPSLNATPLGKARGPTLIQSVWQIASKGPLQFFMDQWRAQGDLPHLRMGPHKLVFAIHPEHVRQILVTGRQGFDKLRTWDSSRRLLLGDGLIGSTGNNFAMLEAHVLAALLARRFDARLVTGHRPQIEMGGTLMVKNGLPMRIERRWV